MRQQRLRARVARHVEADAVTRVAEFLGEIIRAPFAEENSVQLRAARQDAMLMSDQMRRAWLDWLGAESAAKPVILVLDDLQWGDHPSVQFIDAALQHVRDRPWMVFALGRPEVMDRFPTLWSGRGIQTIWLGELSTRASEKLVRAFLGKNAPADVVARVVSQAGGNAFYLEEMIRALADGKGSALPETVLAMAQARLESLPVDARRVLRAASVFGQVFWRGGVVALLGGAKEAVSLDRILNELVEGEILARRDAGRFDNQVEFAFRHSLQREASYAMLTNDDRALGHRLAGAWLEQAGATEAVGLAEHFERGGVPIRAANWYRIAAEQAMEANDFPAAIARAGKGLACGAQGEALGTLNLIIAEAQRWSGNLAAGLAAARSALAALIPGSIGWYTVLGLTAQFGPDIDVLEVLAEAFLVTELAPDAGIARLGAGARLTMQLFFTGNYTLGEELIAHLETSGSTASIDDPRAAAWIHRMYAAQASARGEPGEVIARSAAAAESFERVGDLRNTVALRVNIGAGMIEIGDYAAAEEVLRAGLAVFERMGLTRIKAFAVNNLGFVLGALGKFEEAIAMESDAVALALDQRDRRLQGYSRIYLSEIFTWAGRFEEAEAEAREAVEVLVAVPPGRLYAMAALANVRLHQGAVAGALSIVRDAMEQLETLGTLEAGDGFTRVVFAQALHAAGDTAGACAAIRMARDRLLERAARLQPGAPRAGFLQSVTENARTLELAQAWLGDA